MTTTPTKARAGIDAGDFTEALVEANVDPASARRYLRTFTAIAALLLGGVAALNVIVDPTAIFGSGLLPPLVWNDRAEKLSLLRQAKAVDTLVIGSSRAMKVEPEFLDQLAGGTAFNAALNSAQAEDYLAIYRYARHSAGHPIRTIILAIDPEAFHNGRDVDERLRAQADLANHVPGLRGPSWWGHRFKAALSYTTLLLSLRSIRFAMSAYPEPSSSFDGRGYLTYVQWEREIAQGTFDREAAFADVRSQYVQRYGGFSRLSPVRLGYLRELLDECARDEVRVFAYITPLHQRTRAALAENTPFPDRVRELSALLADELGRRGIPFLDATDVHSFGGDPEGFFDGVHPTAANNRQLLRRLIGSARHAVQ